MNYSKVFDILVKPEVTDEEIKQIYDYSKQNQYTEGRLKIYMEKKLGFDINDKSYVLTQKNMKDLGKLLENFTIREMVKVMEDSKYDPKVQKDKEKRTKKKRKKGKTKKKKSGGADVNKLFKNIKTFTGYKKMYRVIHKIIHNYFRIENIKPEQMKNHILDMKTIQYMSIFNNPKYL